MMNTRVKRVGCYRVSRPVLLLSRPALTKLQSYLSSHSVDMVPSNETNLCSLIPSLALCASDEETGSPLFTQLWTSSSSLQSLAAASGFNEVTSFVVVVVAVCRLNSILFSLRLPRFPTVRGAVVRVDSCTVGHDCDNEAWTACSGGQLPTIQRRRHE
jgi:hypothetical protein